MWCIPNVTPEFVERMEHVLDLYAKPYDPTEPVICFDEKSKQLLAETRAPLPATETTPRRRDYEYKRNGTRNIFCTVEPKGGWRETTVTQRRTKKDFAHEMKRIVELPRYGNARRIHIVCDNLNTHGETSLTETFGKRQGKHISKRISFHYTPKHASWLNMAEIELSILSRQAIHGRIGTEELLKKRVSGYQDRRNAQTAMIRWKFTKEDARKIFQYKLGN